MARPPAPTGALRRGPSRRAAPHVRARQARAHGAYGNAENRGRVLIGHPLQTDGQDDLAELLADLIVWFSSCSGRRHEAEHNPAGHAGDWTSVGVIAHELGPHRKPDTTNLDLPAVVDLLRLNRTAIGDRATGVATRRRPQRAIPFAQRARRVPAFGRGSNGHVSRCRQNAYGDCSPKTCPLIHFPPEAKIGR
jgi:hypothetical protein